MRKRLVLSFLLPSFLFAGCGDGKEDIQEISSKQTTKVSAVLSKEEYVKTVGAYQQELADAFIALNLAAMETDSPDRLKNTKIEIDKVKAILDKYRALNTPREFQDIQKDNLKAMEYFERGSNTFYVALTARNQEMLTEAEGYFDKGNQLLTHTYELLQQTENVPMGKDGTITSQDLKDLDQMAGIDRDSVLKNLSDSGKELVGEWGVTINGKFRVMVVFHEDGSYKRYRDYPDERSIIKGRWKYNHLSKTLILFNDEGYEDGQPMKDLRKELNLDVQSFKANQIQMMDKDTLQIMRYVKA